MSTVFERGRIKVTANGWPWQFVNDHWAARADKSVGEKYGWNPLSVKGMGRFGGGWAFKLGITISSSFRSWVLDLGIGSIRVSIKKKEVA